MPRTNAKPIDRPAPRVYDLSTFPMLNRTAEATRTRVGEYLDYMRKAGKTPAHIDLFPAQFDALTKAVSARIDESAPPLAGLAWGAIPILPLAAGER